MKKGTIIIILSIIFALLIIAYFFFGNSSVPEVPQANTDDAFNDIINSMETGDYNPVDIQVQPATGTSTTKASTTVTNVLLPKAASPSFSPFDKTMYLSKQDSANVLTNDQVNGFINKLHGKLGKYSKFLAAFWNVENTLDSLTAFFQNQLQVSQLANAYFNAYGVDMISDIKNTLSDSDKGRYFISQIISRANNLPLGY
jgi:hypothetical protein